MTKTLFDATLALARTIGVLRTSALTSVTDAGEFSDSTRSEPENHFDNGTLWHHDLEELRVIQSFDGSAFVLQSNLSSSPSSGDRYSAMNAKYPKDWLVDAINNQLIMERYPANDESLTTASGQTKYALPTGVNDIRQIFLLYGDADDPEPKEIGNWWVENDYIHFHTERPDGYTIRLVHVKYHEPIYDGSDTIDDWIPLPRIIPGAAVDILMRLMEDQSTGDETVEKRISLYERRSSEAKARTQRMLPAKAGKAIGYDQ